MKFIADVRAPSVLKGGDDASIKKTRRNSVQGKYFKALSKRSHIPSSVTAHQALGATVIRLAGIQLDYFALVHPRLTHWLAQWVTYPCSLWPPLPPPLLQHTRAVGTVMSSYMVTSWGLCFSNEQGWGTDKSTQRWKETGPSRLPRLRCTLGCRLQQDYWASTGGVPSTQTTRADESADQRRDNRRGGRCPRGYLSSPPPQNSRNPLQNTLGSTSSPGLLRHP